MPQEDENLFQSMSRLIDSGIDPVERSADIWERYGETVAALILDSSGFSRVTESHGIIHFLSRLMLLRNICQPLFNHHNCKRLHFEADNAFAIFDSVEDAIASARELHQKVYEARLMLTETERFRVSMGIGYGKMLFSETLEGYFSEEMNFASKLGEDIARGDETRLTESAYNRARPDSVAGFEAQTINVSGVSLNHYLLKFEPADQK